MAAHQYQWIWDFEDKAKLEGDTKRLRLHSFFSQAARLSHDLPDQKLARFVEARELAKQLGEPWWEMFYEHWVIETLLHGKKQPHLALVHAVRAVVEVSKPRFANFPQGFLLRMKLAAAYTSIDAIGYEMELRGLFAHMEVESALFPAHRAYFVQEWSGLLELLEDEGAVEAAFGCLHNAQKGDSKHYLMVAYKIVCSALMRFDRSGARSHLGELAALGEELARRQKRNYYLTMFLMWRALAARWDGQEREAKRFYGRAMTLQKRLAPPRNVAFFAAMKFHEAGGDLKQALSVCQADIRVLHGHQSTFHLAQSRVDKCRLLKEMGRDFGREAKRLRRVAAQLRSRSHWEARLAELEELLSER